MTEAAPAKGSDRAPSTGAAHDPEKQPDKAEINAKTFSVEIPDSAGHKGTITVNDNAPIESIIITYRAARNLAHHIAKRVVRINKLAPQEAVLLHNATEFASLGELRAFLAIRDDFAALFDALLKAKDLLPKQEEPHLKTLVGEIAAATALFSGLLNTGLQLFSLFRTDQDIKSFKIDIEDQVFAVTVAGQLKLLSEGKFKVFHSATVPSLATGSGVLNSLLRLDEKRREVAEALETLTRGTAKTTPSTDSNDLKAQLEASAILQQTLARAQRRLEHDKSASDQAGAADDGRIDPAVTRTQLIARITKTLEAFDAFKEGLTKVDDKSASSRLSRILSAENLRAWLDKGAYILWVKPVAAGGMSHAKVSTGKSELSYGGGVVASYEIFNGDGEVVEADTIPLYGGKVSVPDLPSVTLGLGPYGFKDGSFDADGEIPGEIRYGGLFG
ncbi:hypothetical protein [Bradyrhizobium sp. SRS-191]|uniref:hypothetical protein n=1 Tax=Bradyrhizobium sp. SRS-191 TaxID=2962606 RepID=UPI00211EED25|nr:hypothetical protein [Bradyrhizobium sp. SRS-191]